MRGKTLLSLLVGMLAMLTTLPAQPPATASTLQAATAIATYTLPDLSLASVQNAVLPNSITHDRGFELGGIGSDMWRHPADPANEYWMLTDRGPNGQICPPPEVAGCTRVRTFPVETFDPLILKVRAEGSALSILQTIPILNPDGSPVSGLSNLNGKDEQPYNFDATQTIPFNPNGLDNEGLVRTSEGEFWVAEEYRPSLVHIDADGKVIRRYIPAGITLPAASYPISDTLPAIFDKRTANRGFEGLALSYDEQTLYIALQSPLSNPSRNVAGTSRNTRILAFDIASGQPSGEWVYRFEPQAEFDPSAPVNPSRINDEMKISGIIAIDKDTLLVLERTDFVAKIYRVTISPATNILGSKWDDLATTPTLEALADPATELIAVLPKSLIIDLDTLGVPDKIEGFALAGANTIAIANDNDFGITSTGIANPAPDHQRSQIITINTDQLTSVLPSRVAVGDVTTSTAVLWAQASAIGTLTFRYGTSESLTGAISSTVTISNTMIPAKLPITGLTAGTRYYYSATDAVGATATGRFITAATGGRQGLHFGVTGDWRGELAPYPAISNAPGRNLDFFVAHGDTIYADYASPALPITQAVTLEQYRVKHAEVYSERFGRNSWGDLRASTAIFATIDDHEVTNDFAGGTAPASDSRFAGQVGAFINETALYNNGLGAFQEYNPLRDDRYGATGDPRTANKRKLYRYQTYGNDAAVMILDNRSFRDQPLPDITNLTDLTQIGNFLAGSFNPSRTMLGKAQLNDLLNDLLNADRAGITWKFVMVPEPIQNFGLLGAADRFEGYAAERTAILSFIKSKGIRNVVFVAADIHGTVVNNLTYQTQPNGPQIGVDAFEITTGSVAFDAPFGPSVIQIAAATGIITPSTVALYNSLPRAGKDNLVTSLINQSIAPFGYDPVGLQGSSIAATLVQGAYTALHTYGWTEFVIDPATQQLRVITYGIDSYSREQIEADPAGILARAPAVVSEFTVTPQPSKIYLPLIRGAQ